jgi:hypothetical protein
MDSPRFDDLARTLHATTGRRFTLGLLLGSLLGLLGRVASEAKGKKKKKRKKGRGGSPPIIPSPPAPPAPPFGTSGCTSDAHCNRCAQETCQAGTCACPEGFIRDARGLCGNRSPCKTKGDVASSAQECCSGRLRQVGEAVTCDAGQERCLSTADCEGGGACLAFMCPERYLATVGEECGGRYGCTNHWQCDSGWCRDGMCVHCQTSNDCPFERAGQCVCQAPADGSANVCRRLHSEAGPFSNCDYCALYGICTIGGPATFWCYQRCQGNVPLGRSVQPH